MKFIFRLIKGLSILLLVSIPLQLIGMLILLPFVYLNQRFSTKDRQGLKLPRIIRWFDNADIYEEFDRDYSTYADIVVPQGTLVRYHWLAIRNPCNYFGYKILGLVVKESVKQVSLTGSLQVGNNTNKIPGLMTQEVMIDDVLRYEYYYIKKYTLKGQSKCFRFRLGHKIGKAADNVIGTHIQGVCAIQPCMDYSGN